MGVTSSRSINDLFARIGRKEMRILMVGLEATGKTTILNKLKLGEIVTTIPTLGFNVETVETVECRNISFTSFDVGRSNKLGSLRREYSQNAQAIIFVVDANDCDRIAEARDELHRMLSQDDDALLLVFANKQDLPDAIDDAEITRRLGLPSLRNRSWFVQATCATNDDGLYESLEWLSSSLIHK